MRKAEHKCYLPVFSHSPFLPKKIVPLNPWWVQGQEQDNQPVWLWSAAAGFHPFPSSAVEAEKRLQRQTCCCSCQWGWVIPMLALEKTLGTHPLLLAGVWCSPNDLLVFSCSCLYLVDADKTNHNSIVIYIYLCTLLLQIIWDGQVCNLSRSCPIVSDSK